MRRRYQVPAPLSMLPPDARACPGYYSH